MVTQTRPNICGIYLYSTYHGQTLQLCAYQMYRRDLCHMEQIINYTVCINNECHLSFSKLANLTMLYNKIHHDLFKYGAVMALPLILTDTNIVTFVFNVFEGVNGIPQKLLSCNMVLLLC